MRAAERTGDRPGRARGRLLAALLGAAALLALPFVLGDFRAYQLASVYLYAIAALGVGLCWGRAGFLPLGQALFFGLGAYLSGHILLGVESPAAVYALLPLAVVAPGLLAFAIGVLVFRRRGESGPYFTMITLALTLLAYQLANSWEAVTGGFNGLKGIPGLPGLDGFTEAYYVAAVALLAALALLAWLLHAPLGVLWSALADNERRAMLFGFDTNRLKAVAFGVSGALGGLAGMLYAPQQGLVTPQSCGFVLSADLVIWAAVGGRGKLLGPVIGAVVVGLLTSELRERIDWWEIVLALVFIIVVLRFPQGLAGALESLTGALARRFGRGFGAGTAASTTGTAAGHGAAGAATGHGATDVGPIAAPPPRRPASANAALTIDDAHVGVGDVAILQGLTLRFPGPGVFCVIGPNGAGKTSTFNLISGELAAQRGRAAFDGEPLTRLAPHRITRLGIGRKFQIPSVFASLTVAENLAIALWSGRVRRRDLLASGPRRWTSPTVDALRARYPFLADGARRAAELSHGQRQVLELAMALAAEPRVLLLDEPCAGLSPQETAAVIETIRWTRARSEATIVIIEHDMALVKEVAEHVHVLHNGALLAQGSVAAVQADPAVRAVYVGAHK
ncbi:MAG: ATP-binding cassette domain-containing protein [Lautropia sp.]